MGCHSHGLRRVHMVGLPYALAAGRTSDPFVTKLVSFCMAMALGDVEVILYSAGDSDTPSDLVPVWARPRPEMRDWNHSMWSVWCHDVARAIANVLEPNEIVLLPVGAPSLQPLLDTLGDLPCCVVEYGVGYRGACTQWKAWESYAWMHAMCGPDSRPEPYDVIIPAFFDTSRFVTNEHGGEHLVFVGRGTHDKGLTVARDVAAACNRKLIVIGGGFEPHDDLDIKFTGHLEPNDRDEVVGSCLALLAPTMYIEPFGYVVAEAQLVGTPAITSDFGAFVENVPDDLRCRTLQDYVDAVECVAVNRPRRRRTSFAARSHYSLFRASVDYRRWFNKLDQLWDEGFYSRRAA